MPKRCSVLVQEKGTTTTVIEELDSFVFDVLRKIAETCRNFFVQLDQCSDEKIGLIKKALAGKASQVFENFLLVLGKARPAQNALPAIQHAVQIVFWINNRATFASASPRPIRWNKLN